MHRNDPASRLIRLRQQLGVSQRELAEEFGVSYGALAMWESGERSIPRVALKIIGIYEETIDQELALKAHEGVIRRLSSSWSARMLATLGKGAKSRERSEIRRQLEDALYSIAKSEISTHQIKRSIQISIFNRFVDAVGRTKGLPLKAVQMMTYMNPGISAEVRDALERIYSLQYPMAPTVVAKVIATSLGASPAELFAEWSPAPFATASIGQVHKARLKSGETVAVKVQYPDVRASLGGDLKALGFLADVAGCFRPGLREAFAVIRDTTLQEVDYRDEARNLRMFTDIFAGDHDLVFPRVYEDFSSDNVLTMDFLEGWSLRDFKAKSPRERRVAAEAIARFMTVSAFCFGRMNTDPHASNFIFLDGGRVGLVDFGRCASVNRDWGRRQGLFLKAVIEGRKEDVREMSKQFPFVKDPATFPFDRFWDFFVKQQKHLNSGPFRFTHEHIERTLLDSRQADLQRHLKVTADFLWSTAVSFGLWHVFAELDVEVDYGRISLAALDSFGAR